MDLIRTFVKVLAKVMIDPIIFDKVVDIYNNYVNVLLNVPFFLKEIEQTDKPVLKLMCTETTII